MNNSNNDVDNDVDKLFHLIIPIKQSKVVETKQSEVVETNQKQNKSIENQIINCFTDASYSQQKKISVVGYKIQNSNVILEILNDVKNTEAELYAIQKCIDICKIKFPNNKINIYTDCQRALKNNYAENIIITKVEGHKKKAAKNDIDMIFSGVDKAVRKKLRELN